MDAATNLDELNDEPISWTPEYARPELKLRDEISPKNDYYSVIISAIVLAGYEPAWFSLQWEEDENQYYELQNSFLVAKYLISNPNSL